MVLLARPGSFQNPTGMQGKGAAQTSSPFSPRDRLAVVVPHFDRHAEAARLDLTAIYRAGRIAEHEATETMSVPPEIEDRQTSFLMRS